MQIPCNGGIAKLTRLYSDSGRFYRLFRNDNTLYYNTVRCNTEKYVPGTTVGKQEVRRVHKYTYVHSSEREKKTWIFSSFFYKIHLAKAMVVTGSCSSHCVMWWEESRGQMARWPRSPVATEYGPCDLEQPAILTLSLLSVKWEF